MPTPPDGGQRRLGESFITSESGSTPRGALNRYLDQKDDLHARRTPRRSDDGLTVCDLLNRFLTVKSDLVDSGELSPRTLRDYKDVCDRLMSAFGLRRVVDDLAAADFELLRKDIAKGRGSVSIGNEVQRVRSVFRYDYEAGLIDKPVRFGPRFRRPNEKTLRKERNKNGKKEFSASEIHAMFAAASVQLKAMNLLGINAAFGNGDVARPPDSSIDLDGGWVDFPRPKTGVERRCPLWPETVKALRDAMAQRSEPKDAGDTDLDFVTKYGKSWHKGTPDNPISNEIRKLLDRLGIHRRGLGFYTLRHIFRTVAHKTRDFPAMDLILGHARDDMASVSRERIGDERLVAVTDHVRTWLFDERETE